MRKFVKAGLCGMAALMVFTTGCSGKKDAGTKTQAASQSEAEEETEEYVEKGSITLGEYKGIPVTVTKAEVLEEEVDGQIQQILNGNAEYLPSDSEAAIGDEVNIAFKGLLNGEAFEGGTSEDYDLVLGSGSFIDGFETGLVGAKKEEERSLNLKFPENYGKAELAGKDVVFEVTVKEVRKRTVPELTDEFIAKISPDDGTVEKFRDTLTEAIREQKQMQIDNQRNTDILEAIIANSEIVCATDDINKTYDTQVQAYTNMAASYGMDLTAYASIYGMDEDGLKSELKNIAKDLAKQEMILNEIASKENISITDEDRTKLAEQYGYDDLESFLADADAEVVDDTALMQKVMDFLVENADITTAEPD